MELPKRFWDKVKKTPGCWLWCGCKNSYGYGHFGFNGKVIGSHRLVWESRKGPIPFGKVIMHKCDIRSCVKFSHLNLGTQKENIYDCIKKGRRGIVNKLTIKEVKKIRKLYANGDFYQYELAKMFGVSSPNISYIIRNIIWKDI